jgi:hypothetical protein
VLEVCTVELAVEFGTVDRVSFSGSTIWWWTVDVNYISSKTNSAKDIVIEKYKSQCKIEEAAYLVLVSFVAEAVVGSD